jgi:hypothetical protein
MDRKLASYLPPPVSSLRELKLLTEAEDPEFDILWDAYDKVRDGAYIETADEAETRRYEKIFGVSPGEGESLENRHTYILTQLSTTVPYTFLWFTNLLVGIYGEDNVDITLDTGALTLTIELKLGSKLFSRIIRDLVKKVVPANVAVTIIVEFNRWEHILSRTWSEAYKDRWYEIKEVKD